MDYKINLTEASSFLPSMFFDANVFIPKDGVEPKKVRFVRWQNSIVILSDNPKWDRHARTQFEMPANLRFEDEFPYSAVISQPRRTGEYQIEDVFSYWESVSNIRLELIPDQYCILHFDEENCFVSDNYECAQLYCGKHDYHHSHHRKMNAPHRNYNYRIGVELEVECRSDSSFKEVTSSKSNWFIMERDGSLNSLGIEFVTVPLLSQDAKDVKFWAPLCDYLRPRAQSWDSPRCGLHVHVGVELLGADIEAQQETLGKLLYLYHHHVKDTDLNTKVFGRAVGYRDKDCKSKIGEIIEILGPSGLRKPRVSKLLSEDLLEQTCDYRYCDINTTNPHTIEFRRGKGSLAPERIASIVTYCELMCKYAKGTRWANISFDNFRRFLVKHAQNSPLFELLNN